MNSRNAKNLLESNQDFINKYYGVYGVDLFDKATSDEEISHRIISLRTNAIRFEKWNEGMECLFNGLVEISPSLNKIVQELIKSKTIPPIFSSKKAQIKIDNFKMSL